MPRRWDWDSLQPCLRAQLREIVPDHFLSQARTLFYLSQICCIRDAVSLLNIHLQLCSSSFYNPFIFLWLIIGVFAYLWSVCFKLGTCFKFCDVLSPPALCSSLTEKPWLWGMGFPQYQEPHPALNWHVPWLLTSVNPVVGSPEPKIRMSTEQF